MSDTELRVDILRAIESERILDLGRSQETINRLPIGLVAKRGLAVIGLTWTNLRQQPDGSTYVDLISMSGKPLFNTLGRGDIMLLASQPGSAEAPFTKAGRRRTQAFRANGAANKVGMSLGRIEMLEEKARQRREEEDKMYEAALESKVPDHETPVESELRVRRYNGAKSARDYVKMRAKQDHTIELIGDLYAYDHDPNYLSNTDTPLETTLYKQTSKYIEPAARKLGFVHSKNILEVNPTVRHFIEGEILDDLRFNKRATLLRARKLKSLNSEPVRSGLNNDGRIVTVVAANQSVITVSLTDPHLPTGPLWLVRTATDVVYDRMRWAIVNSRTNMPRLLQLARGNGKNPRIDREPIQPMGPLNEYQKNAVEYALGSEVCSIHGPPGTGKTATIVEIVRQLVVRGERVLVCGPSNMSVDGVLERVAKFTGDIMRMGNKPMVRPSNMEFYFDNLAAKTRDGRMLLQLITKLPQLQAKRNEEVNNQNKQQVTGQIKKLKREITRLRSRIFCSLVLEKKVVGCTLHAAGNEEFQSALSKNPDTFDTIIIDEVSQSLAPQAWIPLVTCRGSKRLVIAGDNKQLPPTIHSTRPLIRAALQRTVFDELVESYGSDICHLISLQYRMNNTIMAYPSLSMYNDSLTADKSVAGINLASLAGVVNCKVSELPVVWMDTKGKDYKEDFGFSRSILNRKEAALVKKYVEMLREAGVPAGAIGIIAPYTAQVLLLQQLLGHDYEISTVDGFQGREKQVIIMSLVRSNAAKSIGFLADPRRLNVAMTRPKRHLAVIGDSSMATEGHFKNWYDWMVKNMAVDSIKL